MIILSVIFSYITFIQNICTAHICNSCIKSCLSYRDLLTFDKYSMVSYSQIWSVKYTVKYGQLAKGM